MMARCLHGVIGTFGDANVRTAVAEAWDKKQEDGTLPAISDNGQAMAELRADGGVVPWGAPCAMSAPTADGIAVA